MFDCPTQQIHPPTTGLMPPLFPCPAICLHALASTNTTESREKEREMTSTTFNDKPFVVQSPDVTYTEDEMVSKYTYQVGC